MSTLDFLFEGSPPPSVTTYGSTVQGMPQWLSDYTQGLVSRGNAVAGEPYQTYGGPRIAGFTPDQMAAFDRTRSTAGSYLPALSQAQGMTQGAAAAPGALSVAQPFLTQAGQSFPQAASTYMNPYIENVTDRARLLTNRALNEDLLPSLERKFGASGNDVRSSAYRRTADQGVRDLAEGLNSQTLAALAEGYNTAGQQFATDATRFGALGQTAGTLQGQDTSRQLEAARQTGALGELGQQLGLREAGALETVGQTQQQQTQRNLDLAHQDFVEQRDYPRQTLDWMSSLIRGMPYTQTTNTTNTGPADAVGPSPLATLASLATGVGGLWSTFQNRSQPAQQQAKGGQVRRSGALVDRLSRLEDQRRGWRSEGRSPEEVRLLEEEIRRLTRVLERQKDKKARGGAIGYAHGGLRYAHA